MSVRRPKRKTDVVRVYFPDNSYETGVIEATDTCADVVHMIAEKVGLQDTTNFRLFEIHGAKEYILNKDARPYALKLQWPAGVDKSTFKTKSIKARGHAYDETDDAALDSEDDSNDEAQPLPLGPLSPIVASPFSKKQKSIPEYRFVFKAYLRTRIPPRDDTVAHMLFMQAADEVARGRYDIDSANLIKLAGLRAHALFGDYMPAIHHVGFMTEHIAQFIPPATLGGRSEEQWEELIFVEHQKCVGCTTLQAKRLYLDLVADCASLYGSQFFQAGLVSGDDLVPVELAINLDGIVIRETKNPLLRRNIDRLLYDHIIAWTPGKNSMSVEFDEGRSRRRYRFERCQGFEMSDLLAAYTNLTDEQLYGKATKKKTYDQYSDDGYRGKKQSDPTAKLKLKSMSGPRGYVRRTESNSSWDQPPRGVKPSSSDGRTQSQPGTLDDFAFLRRSEPPRKDRDVEKSAVRELQTELDRLDRSNRSTKEQREEEARKYQQEQQRLREERERLVEENRELEWKIERQKNAPLDKKSQEQYESHLARERKLEQAAIQNRRERTGERSAGPPGSRGAQTSVKDGRGVMVPQALSGGEQIPLDRIDSADMTIPEGRARDEEFYPVSSDKWDLAWDDDGRHPLLKKLPYLTEWLSQNEGRHIDVYTGRPKAEESVTIVAPGHVSKRKDGRFERFLGQLKYPVDKRQVRPPQNANFFIPDSTLFPVEPAYRYDEGPELLLHKMPTLRKGDKCEICQANLKGIFTFKKHCHYCGRVLCTDCADREAVMSHDIAQEGKFDATPACKPCAEHLAKTQEKPWLELPRFGKEAHRRLGHKHIDDLKRVRGQLLQSLEGHIFPECPARYFLLDLVPSSYHPILSDQQRISPADALKISHGHHGLGLEKVQGLYERHVKNCPVCRKHTPRRIDPDSDSDDDRDDRRGGRDDRDDRHGGRDDRDDRRGGRDDRDDRRGGRDDRGRDDKDDRRGGRDEKDDRRGGRDDRDDRRGGRDDKDDRRGGRDDRGDSRGGRDDKDDRRGGRDDRGDSRRGGRDDRGDSRRGGRDDRGDSRRGGRDDRGDSRGGRDARDDRRGGRDGRDRR